MLRAPATGNLELRYELPWAPVVSWNEAGTIVIRPTSAASSSRTLSTCVRLFDARLTWVSPQSAYEVSLWGRNWRTGRGCHVYTIAKRVFGVYGEPRTYV